MHTITSRASFGEVFEVNRNLLWPCCCMNTCQKPGLMNEASAAILEKGPLLGILLKSQKTPVISFKGTIVHKQIDKFSLEHKEAS